MLRLIKQRVFTGLTFFSTLTGENMLLCISMNNQEYKVRPQIINVNGDDPVLFFFKIKTSRYNGSCNNVNSQCG